MIGDDVAVRPVIVIEFATKIVGDARERVVEFAVAAAGGIGDEHIGDRLVERVALLGVIAHRIETGEAKAAAGAVHRARAFAQRIMAIARAALEKVVRAAVPPAEIIRLSRAVGGDRLPGRAVMLFPHAAQAVQRDRHADLGGGDDQHAIGFLDRRRGAGEARDVHPVAPGFRDILGPRGDRPARRAGHRAVREQQEADDIVLEHEQMRHRASIGGERDPSVRALGQREQRRIGDRGASHANSLESGTSGNVRRLTKTISTAAPIRSNTASAPNNGA